MNEFTLSDVNSEGALQLRGDIPRGREECDAFEFEASFCSRWLTATIGVYDVQPQRWATYFADLASNWRGWSGSKICESLEGDLKLEATSDSVGHIRIDVSFQSVHVGPPWSAHCCLFLEAGQLEATANRAKYFFG